MWFDWSFLLIWFRVKFFSSFFLFIYGVNLRGYFLCESCFGVWSYFSLGSYLDEECLEMGVKLMGMLETNWFS